MNSKDIQQKFSADLDESIYGAANDLKGAGEYKELLELGRVLAHKDFSEGSDKTAILNKARRKYAGQKEEKGLRTKHRLRRPAVMLATLLVVSVLSVTFVQPSFAQELLMKVLQTINLGHIVAHEVEFSADSNVIPDDFKGKIFDSKGNALVTLDAAQKAGDIYNADGEKIVGVEDGRLVTQSERDQEKAELLIERDSSKLNEYTIFNVGLPEYLPDGYTFDRAEFYKDSNGEVINSKYINLYFVNEATDEIISMQQRHADSETAYEMSTDGTIEKVKINGADAVLVNGKGLDWEANGVLYGVTSASLDKNDLIKVAESIR
ncbi:DUF4367 domain-containing protein [Paenibacillus odorifer]|uniref:DUF4367 domain-containing protein n=1 Tax=Paenibacillus TaxID=44249 RepID=UPI0004F89297|nr:DUF4367 domain-containing protein [Paenibacillus odorifer]AIQ72746.1 hypothetical protein PODO_05425 [Paenibacillus odorifer]OMD10925.1 hypothetical protein BJP47_27355 [Paenibacillus odorifer]OME22941.1 hypothetical protein BSK57_17110 [Paenibacillus odorifer]